MLMTTPRTRHHHSAQARWLATALTCALVMGATGPVQARAAPGSSSPLALPACMSVTPSHVSHITSLPPHQSWPHSLPDTRNFGWSPLSNDRNHVLMQNGRHTFNHAYIPLAIVTAGGRRRLIPRAEYPHLQLERTRLEYPWIVGLRATQRPPADWKLWAANIVTGRHFILDHGNGLNAKVQRQYPDFALNRHRVVWNDVATPTRAYGAANHRLYLWNRLDLYNLDTRRKSVIASTSDGRTLYMQPTISGRTVVWVRMREPRGKLINPIYDLVLAHLGSRTVTNLTHNTHHSGVSIEPSLWGHYLLYKQSGNPYDYGDIRLWDLSKGEVPLRLKPGATLLMSQSGEMPEWDGGVAWWNVGGATSAAYIPGTGRVWTFQTPAHMGLPKYYKYTWQVASGDGGGNLVIKRADANTLAHPIDYVWHFPRAKNWLCR